MSTDRILLDLKSVSKSYGSVSVLDGIDMEVRDGEFITILGPSGSGKTTILRMVGGFTAPSSGRILLEGRDITAVPINRRPFNTVFQDYALFPHMTVAQNIGYGLMVRGTAHQDVQRRVGETLDLVQLADLADRAPAQLSGGQQQRVALARAIICEPRLILLDEPLAALDVELRKQMQIFLKDVQREIKTTFLFVTHDQEEAIAMADRICVINVGRIQQFGSPHEVYYRPRVEFVGRFFGHNNLIEGRLAGGDTRKRFIDTPIGTLVCAVDGQVEVAGAETGRRAFAAIRPEAISVGDGRAVENSYTGKVAAVSFGGATTLTEVSVPVEGGHIDMSIKSTSRADGAAVALGDHVKLSWSAEECRLILA